MKYYLWRLATCAVDQSCSRLFLWLNRSYCKVQQVDGPDLFVWVDSASGSNATLASWEKNSLWSIYFFEENGKVQGFWATCCTFSPSYLGTSYFVCVCVFLFFSCFMYSSFLHGFASGQLEPLLSLDHRRWDDRQSLGARTAAAKKKLLTLTRRLCRHGRNYARHFPPSSTVLLRELHSLFCGWTCEAKEKASLVCLLLPLLRLLVLMVGKSGGLYSRAVHGCHKSPIRRQLERATQNCYAFGYALDNSEFPCCLVRP